MSSSSDANLTAATWPAMYAVVPRYSKVHEVAWQSFFCMDPFLPMHLPTNSCWISLTSTDQSSKLSQSPGILPSKWPGSRLSTARMRLSCAASLWRTGPKIATFTVGSAGTSGASSACASSGSSCSRRFSRLACITSAPSSGTTEIISSSAYASILPGFQSPSACTSTRSPMAYQGRRESSSTEESALFSNFTRTRPPRSTSTTVPEDHACGLRMSPARFLTSTVLPTANQGHAGFAWDLSAQAWFLLPSSIRNRSVPQSSSTLLTLLPFRPSRLGSSLSATSKTVRSPSL
mmetsp:Transcript_45342/g.129915  ORF Transcript_45342/g.129915 Transcript_45342/m.129915 type:complete len:291 (+) Transcript_45342:1503-2375(+)